MPLNTKQKLWAARQLSRAIIAVRAGLGRGPALEAVRRGVRWHLDLREGIELAVYLGLYERGTAASLRRCLRPGATALDIGANVGVHTLPMAKSVAPDGRVVAFEPTAYAFGRLVRNVALNRDLAKGIECRQTLLVARPTMQALPAIHASWPLAGAADLHPIHRGRLMDTTGASASTLDESVRKLGLQRVDLIKLDVDGHELAILSGGRETLARFRPVIVMEFALYLHDPVDGGLPTLLELLADFGYTAMREQGSTSVPLTADAIQARCPEGGSVNLVLQPPA